MRNKVIKIFKEICPSIKNPEYEQGLISNMIIDSFEMVQIVMALMEEFKIDIGIEDINSETMDNIKSICNMIKNKINCN